MALKVETPSQLRLCSFVLRFHLFWDLRTFLDEYLEKTMVQIWDYYSQSVCGSCCCTKWWLQKISIQRILRRKIYTYILYTSVECYVFGTSFVTSILCCTKAFWIESVLSKVLSRYCREYRVNHSRAFLCIPVLQFFGFNLFLCGKFYKNTSHSILVFNLLVYTILVCTNISIH